MSFHLTSVNMEWLGKKLGDEIEVNGQMFEIIEIYKNGSANLKAIDRYATIKEVSPDDINYKKREKQLKRKGLW